MQNVKALLKSKAQTVKDENFHVKIFDSFLSLKDSDLFSENFQSISIGGENRFLSGGKKGPRSVESHGMQTKEKNIHTQGLPLSQMNVGIKISFTSSSGYKILPIKNSIVFY